MRIHHRDIGNGTLNRYIHVQIEVGQAMMGQGNQWGHYQQN